MVGQWWLQQESQRNRSRDNKEEKNWTVENGKIRTEDRKFIIPKQDIFKTLTAAHSAIAHWGRDKTEQYIRDSFSEISQDVTALFVHYVYNIKVSVIIWRNLSWSHWHLAAFLNVEIDLIDFHKIPCVTCTKLHQWVLHVIEHYLKYSWLYVLHSKCTEEVIESLQQIFYLFGFSSILHSDNGRV